jgi:hypothetical protein
MGQAVMGCSRSPLALERPLAWPGRRDRPYGEAPPATDAGALIEAGVGASRKCAGCRLAERSARLRDPRSQRVQRAHLPIGQTRAPAADLV